MPLSNSYKRLMVAILVIVLAGLLIICVKLSTRYEISGEKLYASVDKAGIDLSYLNVTELDQELNMDEPVSLSLKNGVIDITTGGDYYLKGRMEGMIHINAQEQIVHLFLDGIEVKSYDGPALYCENAGKLLITLVDGSNNVFSDSGNYKQYDEPDSCIYSECGLTVNGTGSLTVNGYYKDAIRSKDVVKALGGDYYIKCKRTGIRGNDGIVISGNSFVISSEKNAFKTTNYGPEGRGSIIIGGGNLRIVAGEYSFVTKKADLYMFNCIVNSRNVIDTFDVGGQLNVIEGCVQ